MTKSVNRDIKKPLLIVCAPSVKLGAGPLAWGLPGSSIAYVVVETPAGRSIPRVVRSVSESRRVVFRGAVCPFLNDDKGAGTGLDFLRGVCYAVAIQ